MTEPNECRQAREKLGMTQAEFAEALGIQQSAISDWETGKRKIRQRDAMAFKALVNGAKE